MALDAQSKQLQKAFNSLGLRPETMSPEDVRATFAAGRDQRPPGPGLARVEDKAITVTDGAGAKVKLPVRIYAASKREGLPVVVYFHGGGWVLGDLDGDDPACRQLAKSSGAMVVSVNYRHAPEHPFPAAADDSWAALQWLARNARRWGGDPTRLAVAGWSAGGNLAAVAAQRAAAAGLGLRGQVLVTPVTDADFSRGSYRENGDGFVLTKPFLQWFWDHYLPAKAARRAPTASPLRAKAKALAGCCPAYVITAEHDPLRDEGEAYALALAQAGVQVSLRRWLGNFHLIWSQHGVLDASEAAQRAAGEWLKDVLR
jgi:acetyl esterase/lipase